jgi:hypothetical protein
MLAATCLAVFLIPALYVLVERLSRADRRQARKAAARAEESQAEGAVEGLPVPEESHP